MFGSQQCSLVNAIGFGALFEIDGRLRSFLKHAGEPLGSFGDRGPCGSQLRRGGQQFVGAHTHRIGVPLDRGRQDAVAGIIDG